MPNKVSPRIEAKRYAPPMVCRAHVAAFDSSIIAVIMGVRSSWEMDVSARQ